MTLAARLTPSLRSLLAVGLLLVACTDERAAITGTQSLEITLVDPADPGAPDRRLPDTQGNDFYVITIDIAAKNAQGELDTTFDADVQVFAQFLGTLTPAFGSVPLATFHLTAGIATGKSITVPAVFGPTTLWIDDGSGLGNNYVHGVITGTAPTLWFRDPFIVDLQTPRSCTGRPTQRARGPERASRPHRRGLRRRSRGGRGWLVAM